MPKAYQNTLQEPQFAVFRCGEYIRIALSIQIKGKNSKE